jgi:hypothetical protein
MKPMAAAAVGALIAGIAVYAVGTHAANDPFAQIPALVQTVDGRYIQVPDARTVGFPMATLPLGSTVTPQPTVAPAVVRQTPAPAPARVYRTAAPAPVQERVVERETRVVDQETTVAEARPERSWAKTAMIVGGSAASGAGVGGIVGGKKGALVGAAIGGGAASIYEATRRK